MKKLLTLFLLGLTVSFSASALPVRGRTIQSNMTQNAPSDNCGAIDPYRACWTSSSSDYLQCTAKGSLNQLCQATLIDPNNKQQICASVRMAGGCQCDPKTKATTGSCQYMK